MEGLLGAVSAAFDTFGAALVLGAVIAVMGIVVGVGWKRAFMSFLYIGISLTVMFWILDAMRPAVGGAIKGMVTSSGIQLPYYDVGWMGASAVAYATRVGLFIIPLAFAVNIVMLALRLTRVVNLDVWNFWHFAFPGAMAYAVTGSIWAGFAAATIAELFTLLLAEMQAPSWQQYNKFEGLAPTTLDTLQFVLWIAPVNWLLKKLGVYKIQVTPERIRERFGIIGDPVVLGALMGLIIGLLANWTRLGTMKGWADTASLVITLASVVYFFPKAAMLLMEGFMPVAQAFKEKMQARGTEGLLIGVDYVVGYGDPGHLAVALLYRLALIPLMIIVPWNRFLFFADMGWVGSLAAISVAQGNILAAFLMGVLYLPIGMWFVTNSAPLFTRIATQFGVALPAGAQAVNSGFEGSGFLFWSIFNAFRSPLFVAALVGVYLVLLFAYRRNPRWFHVALGYREPA